MGIPKPYEIELTYLGNIDLSCLSDPTLLHKKSIKDMLNSPKETYFLDLRRRGGMTGAECDALILGKEGNIGTMGTLDKIVDRFLYLCGKKDLFEDIFVLVIDEQTRQRLGLKLCENLELAVKTRNKRYENKIPSASSKHF